MKIGLLYKKETQVFINLNKFLFNFYIKFSFFGLSKIFFFSGSLLNLSLEVKKKFFYFYGRNYSVLRLYLNEFRLVFNLVFFFFRFFVFRLFKSHGINMRVILKEHKKKVFLRIGTSHGFYISLPRSILLRSFKKRYFFILGYDLRVINFVSYHFRFFKKFFKYKLIGIKYLRDVFTLKVGKKKAF